MRRLRNSRGCCPETRMTILRSAVESDKNAIFALHEELFRPHIDQIWGWNDEWQRGNFLTEWDRAQTEVIECDEHMAGYLQTERGNNPEHLYVLSLAISPEHQGRGVGTHVMNTLMRRTTKQHLPVRLNVFRTNPAALRFYLRLGFETDGSTESGVALKWPGETLPEGA